MQQHRITFTDKEIDVLEQALANHVAQLNLESQNNPEPPAEEYYHAKALLTLCYRQARFAIRADDADTLLLCDDHALSLMPSGVSAIDLLEEAAK